jgi:hypothetical protein
MLAGMSGLSSSRAQEAAGDRDTLIPAKSLNTGFALADATANIESLVRLGAPTTGHAQYSVSYRDGRHDWCRTEVFDLKVTPYGATLSFVPALSDSCPDPRPVTAVCRPVAATEIKETRCAYVNDRYAGSTAHRDMLTDAYPMWCTITFGEETRPSYYSCASDIHYVPKP